MSERINNSLVICYYSSDIFIYQCWQVLIVGYQIYGLTCSCRPISHLQKLVISCDLILAFLAKSSPRNRVKSHCYCVNLY